MSENKDFNIGRLKDFFSIIILCGCSFVFLSNLFLNSQIFTSQDIGQGDLTHYVYPFKDNFKLQLRLGKFSLWTDLIATGFPIIGENASNYFFLNLILYYLFPSFLAFNFSFLAIFIIASTGAYFYGRFFGLTRIASLFTGICYAFSFVFIGHIIHLNVLYAISLAPWLFLFAERFMRNNSRFDFLIFSVLLSQQYLAGFVQATIYLVTGVLIIIFLRYYRKVNFIKKVTLLFFSCVFAVGLSAFQFLPTLELVQHSTRIGFDPKGFNYPFTIKDLGYFVYPYFWGDPSTATYFRDPKDGLFWENNIYAGVLPFIFLITAFIFFIKKKELRHYFYFFIITLVFSLGYLFIFRYIPPFSGFRLPQRALFLTLFAYTLIAGFVFDKILNYLKSIISNKFTFYLITFGIVFVAFLDLFLYGYGYNGGISVDEFIKPYDTISFLKSRDISGRIISVGGPDDWHYIYNNVSHGWRSENADKLLANRALMSPNANVLYGIPSFNGYTSYQTPEYNLMYQVVNYGNVPGKMSRSSAKLYGMENVEYIISSIDLTSEANDLELVWKKTNDKTTTTYRIYKNKQFLERIRPVSRVYGVMSNEQIIKGMLNPDFTPKDSAFVQSINQIKNFSDNTVIKNIKKDPQEIIFRTKADKESFIVIADSVYPGWKALIDNKESFLNTVNINNKGIVVPPGEHTVKIYYDPYSFKLGMAISIYSYLIGIIIFIFPYIKKFIRLIIYKKRLRWQSG